MCRHSLHNRENWGIGANMLIQKRKPVPCFDFSAAPTCCPLPNDSTPGTVNTCGRGFPLLPFPLSLLSTRLSVGMRLFIAPPPAALRRD